MFLWALFLMPCPPPNPGEDQNPLALEPRGICCDVCFLHAHFLLVNTILPQHSSWQGPAWSEHSEYSQPVFRVAPRRDSPRVRACQSAWLPTKWLLVSALTGISSHLLFFPHHWVYSWPFPKFRTNLHSGLSLSYGEGVIFWSWVLSPSPLLWVGEAKC